VVTEDYTDGYRFECTGCHSHWELHPDKLVERLEITYLFKSEAVYRVAVCTSCGSLVSPYLEEVDESDL